MPFYTRPNFEDRQVVQYSGTSIVLSGDTNINPTGNLRIYKNAAPGLVATSLDFNGTVVWGPLSGVSWSVSACTSPFYVNNIVACPTTGGTIQLDAGNLALNSQLNFLINLSAGTTTDNVLVIDSGGYVKSVPQSSITPIFTGGTGSCVTDLYVRYVHGCSPISIQPTSLDDVYMVMGGGNVGIGTQNPTQKLHVSGNTRIEDDVNADVSLAVVNNNSGGTSTRATISTSAIVDTSGRILSGVFTTSGYNTALAGFSDSGTGYLKSALSITLAGNVPRGDINIGTRDSGKFLRFFSGSLNFNASSLRGSLNSNGYWGFGTNVTGQTATVQIGDETNSGTFRIVDGNQQNDYVLTSDSNGNATWQVTKPYRYVSGTSILPLFGNNNIITSNWAFVSNGVNNVISSGSNYSTIIGGSGHTITNGHLGSAIVGGFDNLIHGPVPGNLSEGIFVGSNNIISGTNASYSTVIGGFENQILNANRSGIYANKSVISNGIVNYIIGGEEVTINGVSNAMIINGFNTSISNNGIIGGSNSSLILDSAGFSVILGGIDVIITGSSKVYTLGSDKLTVNNNSYKLVDIGGFENYVIGNNTTGLLSNRSNIILGGLQNKIYNYGDNSLLLSGDTTANIIINGDYNTINNGINYSAIIGGNNNVIDISNEPAGKEKVIILGLDGISATTSNTVYVPDLVIKKSAAVPTTSGDTVGEIGSVTWDDNYFYIKTNNGWGRIGLDYVF